METRVVPVRPQVQWRVLLQRCAGDRHTLDGSWEHHRICGEKHPCGSVTFGKLKHYPWCQALAYFASYHYQLLDVVKGIRYLHNCNIAHGDIKAVSPSSFKPHEVFYGEIYLVLSRTSSFRTPTHHDPFLQTSVSPALQPSLRNCRPKNRARRLSWLPNSFCPQNSG